MIQENCLDYLVKAWVDFPSTAKQYLAPSINDLLLHLRSTSHGVNSDQTNQKTSMISSNFGGKKKKNSRPVISLLSHQRAVWPEPDMIFPLPRHLTMCMAALRCMVNTFVEVFFRHGKSLAHAVILFQLSHPREQELA